MKKEKMHITQIHKASALLQIGAIVKYMRTHAGLSQTELANSIKADQSYISKIERGQGRNGPTIETICTIAEACGVALDVTVSQKAGQPTSPKPF